MREVMNAILHIAGKIFRRPRSYFHHWRDIGLWQSINHQGNSVSKHAEHRNVEYGIFGQSETISGARAMVEASLPLEIKLARDLLVVSRSPAVQFWTPHLP